MVTFQSKIFYPPSQIELNEALFAEHSFKIDYASYISYKRRNGGESENDFFLEQAEKALILTTRAGLEGKVLTISEAAKIARAYRQAGDKETYSAIKNQLPSIAVAGLFNKKRRLEDLKIHTGLIVLEADELQEIAEKTIQKVFKNAISKRIVAYGKSFSGEGVYFILKIDIKDSDSIDAINAQHLRYFNMLSHYFSEILDIKIDQSGKDIPRLRYLSPPQDNFLNDDYASPVTHTHIKEAEQKFKISFNSSNHSTPRAATAFTANIEDSTAENFNYIYNIAKERYDYDAVHTPIFYCADRAAKAGLDLDLAKKYIFSLFEQDNARFLSKSEDYVERAWAMGVRQYPATHSKFPLPSQRKRLEAEKSLNFFKDFLENRIDISLNREKISNSDFEIPEIAEFSDQEKLIIQARAGAGKTEYFVRNALKNQEYTIFTLPYKILLNQAAQRFSGMEGVAVYIDKDSVIQDNARVIFCTYDNTLKAFSHFADKKAALIVDEFHNLSGQVGFRSEAIYNVELVMRLAKKTRLLSATPEPLWIEEGFTYLNLVTVSSHKRRYTIKKTGGKDITARKVQEIAKKLAAGEKVAAMLRSRTDAESFARTFADKYKVCVVYNSDTQKILDNIDYISENQAVPPDTQLLINTTKLSDGSQIFNKNFNNIFIDCPHSLTDVIQYPARFRSSKKQDIVIFQSEPKYASDFGNITTSYRANKATIQKAIELKKEDTLGLISVEGAYGECVKNNEIFFSRLMSSATDAALTHKTPGIIAAYLSLHDEKCDIEDLPDLFDKSANEVKSHKKTLQQQKADAKKSLIEYAKTHSLDLLLYVFKEHFIKRDYKTKRNLNALAIPSFVDSVAHFRVLEADFKLAEDWLKHKIAQINKVHILLDLAPTDKTREEAFENLVKDDSYVKVLKAKHFIKNASKLKKRFGAHSLEYKDARVYANAYEILVELQKSGRQVTRAELKYLIQQEFTAYDFSRKLTKNIVSFIDALCFYEKHKTSKAMFYKITGLKDVSESAKNELPEWVYKDEVPWTLELEDCPF